MSTLFLVSTISDKERTSAIVEASTHDEAWNQFVIGMASEGFDRNTIKRKNYNIQEFNLPSKKYPASFVTIAGKAVC